MTNAIAARGPPDSGPHEHTNPPITSLRTNPQPGPTTIAPIAPVLAQSLCVSVRDTGLGYEGVALARWS